MSKNTKVMNISFGSTNPNDPAKKYWQTVGAFFITTTDTGEQRYSIKLNCLPLSNEFDGFLSVFERDETKGSKPSQDPEF
jgi:hypothetical protein